MEERRKLKRSKVLIPFRFMEIGRNREGVGEITNLSSAGAGMLVTCEMLELFAQLEMWLDLPDMPGPLHAKGTVNWLKKIAPGIYRIGICFDRVDFIEIARVLKL
jgi:hypothetical protein